MRFRIAFFVLAFSAALAIRGAGLPSPGTALAQAGKPDPGAEEMDWQGLPPGKGREETFYTCNPCHSLRMVTQQGLSRSRWDEAIDWMVKEQEMPALDAPDRKLIVDYLARYYGEDRKAKGGQPRLP